jgi:hypothetical protein
VIPRAAFVVVLTVVSALGTGALTAFFSAGPGLNSEMLRGLIPHALINGAFAPFGVWLVERVSNWLSEVDSGHQLLQLRPRNRLS